MVSNVSYSTFTVRLIFAGWLPQGEVFDWSGAAGLASGVTPPEVVLSIAAKRVTPRVRRHTSAGATAVCGLVVHHRERPAPPGKFAGDGSVGHDGPFLPGGEGHPLVVQAEVAFLAAEAGRSGSFLPPRM
jgi:hypothetical protein